MESVIFLDIDGVLVTSRGLEHWMKIKCDIFEDNTSYELFCPQSIESLNRLTRLTGSKLVIISNWRKRLSLIEIKQMFKRRGVEADIIGVTPYKNEDLDRGHEIKLWLEKNGTPDSYVIIDDDCDVDISTTYFPEDRCVQTNSVFGIADRYAYKRAVGILNKPIIKEAPSSTLSINNKLF